MVAYLIKFEEVINFTIVNILAKFLPSAQKRTGNCARIFQK